MNLNISICSDDVDVIPLVPQDNVFQGGNTYFVMGMHRILEGKVHMCVYTCVYACVGVSVCVCVCMCVHVHVSVYVYVCVDEFVFELQSG